GLADRPASDRRGVGDPPVSHPYAERGVGEADPDPGSGAGHQSPSACVLRKSRRSRASASVMRFCHVVLPCPLTLARIRPNGGSTWANSSPPSSSWLRLNMSVSHLLGHRATP